MLRHTDTGGQCLHLLTRNAALVTSAVPESEDEPNLTNTRFCAETKQHDVCNPQIITAHGEEFAIKTRRTTAVAGPVLGEDSKSTNTQAQWTGIDGHAQRACQDRLSQPNGYCTDRRFYTECSDAYRATMRKTRDDGARSRLFALPSHSSYAGCKASCWSGTCLDRGVVDAQGNKRAAPGGVWATMS